MSTTTASQVTFKKLRDGTWGVQGQGLQAGKTVTVVKKSGETSTATIGKVLFTGKDGYQIATLAASSRPRRNRYTGFDDDDCHTDGNCSSMCMAALRTGRGCPCLSGGWFRCC